MKDGVNGKATRGAEAGLGAEAFLFTLRGFIEP
jgi:hypothetical protein